MIYTGGCHCGVVRFEIDAPEAVEVEDCNCSICAKSGFRHLILPRASFRLLQGADFLTSYRFNTRVAEHLFCRVCGVKPYYIPRSNPDGIDVNLRCLDSPPARVSVRPFDGQHWEANAATLSHKSRPQD